MKITDIDIEYFRGLSNLKLHNPDEHVNLFVGINGAGKSSVLDAMAYVFSWFVARFNSPAGRGNTISNDDINITSPNGCTIDVKMDGRSWKLYRSLKYKKTDKSDFSDLNQKAAMLNDDLESNPNVSIPLIAYYGPARGRVVNYPRQRGNSRLANQKDAYKNALQAGERFSEFFNWFKNAEDYENELYREGKIYRDPGLEAVKRCLEKCMPGYGDLKVSRRPLAMTMRKGNQTLKLNQLSEGEKSYMMLVSDIARRLSLANPDTDPLLGEGIILIDEIELHLHPKWQQTVISNLTNTFPNCQFFITTHSPLVASDVKGKVFGIRDGEISEEHTYGKLSSNILSDVFDLSMARNLYVQSLIDKAYDTIHNSDAVGFETCFSELKDILGVSDIEIANLRIEKARWEKAISK